MLSRYTLHILHLIREISSKSLKSARIVSESDKDLIKMFLKYHVNLGRYCFNKLPPNYSQNITFYLCYILDIYIHLDSDRLQQLISWPP